MAALTGRLTLKAFLDLIQPGGEPGAAADVHDLARRIIIELYDEDSDDEANGLRIAAGLAFPAYELLNLEKRVRKLAGEARRDPDGRPLN